MSNMSNCTNEFPTSQQLFKDLEEDVPVVVLTAILGVVVLAILAIFVEEVHFVIQHYTHKELKLKIMAMLGLYPVIASSCMIGLLFPRATMLTELLSAIYLSFCVLIFVRLIIGYFGSDAALLQECSGQPFSFRTGPCCCCCICLRNFEFSQRNLNVAKIFTLQVAFVRPIVLFIRAVMWTDGEYELGESLEPKKFAFYLQILNAASTLFAIYGMIVIYTNTAPKLSKYRLGFKFAALQLVILLFNMQALILSILSANGIPECKGVRGSIVRGFRINYMLLIFELLLLSIFARFGYRRHEEKYKSNENETEVNHETVQMDTNSQATYKSTEKIINQS